MNEQNIEVEQTRSEQTIELNSEQSERTISAGSERSVLHGIDGVSPIATVTQTENGAIVSITDRDGTTTATISNGQDGSQGPIGPQGEKGDKGERGEKGDKGDKGDQGVQGVQGVQGEKGDQGIRGETGPKGEKGDKGDKGDTGERGLQGIQGPKGDTGATGPQGPKGDKGDTGPQGPQGIQGAQGIQGIQGDKGDTGPGVVMVTEDIVTVTTDTTKGVAPYSTSYGYTNIEVDLPTPVEGSVVTFVINTKMVVASATRNVRVKFNDSDTWHPVMNASTTILAGSSYFTKAMTRLFEYKSTQQSIGALHMINDDNTTYAYLVNTIGTGFHTVETGGYMARYAISFYTQPMKTGNKVSSFVTASGTSASKAYTSVAKYYADRGPVINYSASVAAAAATANVVYTYYQGMDLRYTANLSTTYIATNDHVFAYLKNFDPDDYSFEPSKDTKQIVSATKLATAFPSTTAGDIYLYLLGTNTGTYYTLNTPEKETNFIYKFTPSTGALIPLGGSGSVSWGNITDKPTIPTAGTITSGSTGYATGGDVYNAIGNIETILSTLNNGGGAQ